ncbi:MAG: c-type cytochrome [Planctomycetales bacterium]|nr:c-type cytochrome [Planctomycetales bacterium]
MKLRLKSILTACLVLLVSGCTPDPKSGKGFTLPEGDAQRGMETFVALNCNVCHTVEGTSIEPIETEHHKIVKLGGKKGYVVTYGELVTSIINPSHRFAIGYPLDEISKDGESKMRLYNDEMTVSQLADLVTFLEQHYELEVYHPTPYVPYY